MEENRTPRHFWNRRTLKYAAASLAAIAVFFGRGLFTRADTVAYTHVPVDRGDVVKTISATGKLQAVVTVQVGSQVSGRIAELHADFNSRVKKGQVIAKLDPALFNAQLAQAQGNFGAAKAKLDTANSAVANAVAGVTSAQANVAKLQAARDDARSAYQRTDALVSTGAVSAREVESAQAAYSQAQAQLQQGTSQVEEAKAQLLSARSQVNEAKAQVEQTRAAVESASANLEYSIIRAPIDGVVIARNVDVGQTVAASFQAPTLFLIANDLTQMQVLADIDEADVGQLGSDSKVSFTVDAFPHDVFHGKVSQVRLNPQIVQNVVTYTAVVDVANPELKLKPGMTANVTATVADARGVLRVPNAALRFRPEAAPAGPRGSRPHRGGQETVWKLDGEGKLHPVAVTTGITDGIHTEILSGNLKPGDALATGQEQAGGKPAGNNPFMPFGHRGGKK